GGRQRAAGHDQSAYCIQPTAYFAAKLSVSGDGSLVRRRSLFTSPMISITPQLRHIIAFVITSPVSSVRNFDSCGRNEVRTAEINAPAENEFPPHREQVTLSIPSMMDYIGLRTTILRPGTRLHAIARMISGVSSDFTDARPASSASAPNPAPSPARAR